MFLFPTLFGLFAEPASRLDFVRHVGIIWLFIGIGGGLFRVVQLFITRDVLTGLVWVFKVLTDPFHNIAIYCKSPLALMRGELIDRAIGSADRNEDEIEDAPRFV